MQVTFRKHINDVNVSHTRTVGNKNNPGPVITPTKSAAKEMIPPGKNATEKHPEVEVIEIRYDNGNVSVFPAHEHNTSGSAELGRDVTFAETYPVQYSEFKTGNPDRTRVAKLEAEIKQRQDELATIKTPSQPTRPVPAALGRPTQPALGQGQPPSERPVQGTPIAGVVTHETTPA